MPLPCAGVALINGHREIAVVYSHAGYPSLPKGKREQNETNQQCALRELAEETNVHLNARDLVPDVSFVERTRKGHAVCEYFVARVPGRPELLSADDEDIVEGRWVPLRKMMNENWKSNRVPVMRAVQRYAQKNSRSAPVKSDVFHRSQFAAPVPISVQHAGRGNAPAAPAVAPMRGLVVVRGVRGDEGPEEDVPDHEQAKHNRNELPA